MDWTCTVLGRLEQLGLREEATAGRHASESSSLDQHTSLPLPAKIDDHVVEVYKPAGTPSVEVVFFIHTILEETTWTPQEDQSECWAKMLQDEFPEARIVAVACDNAKASTSRAIGQMTSEHLVDSLTRTAKIGQTGCPVLIVSHCLAAPVIKCLCYQAKLMLNQDWSQDPLDNFLINLKGLLFYGTPNDNESTTSLDSELLGDLTPTKLDEIFRKLCKRYLWKTVEVAEVLRADDTEEFGGLVVPQESSTTHESSHYSASVDHHNTSSRASGKNSTSYQALITFLHNLLTEAEEDLWHNLGAQSGSAPTKPAGLDELVREAENKLRGHWRLGIVGTGGAGKTTLARAVFQNISKNFEYTCFFDEVSKVTADKVPLKSLQAKIGDRMHREGKEFRIQWSQLRGKKVLLVMDDVDSVDQLGIMSSCPALHFASRVIVTSRSREFLEEQNFPILSMERLSSRDSVALFRKYHAVKEHSTIPEERQKRLPRLIDKCGGVPLVLKVVAALLTSTCDWDDVLKRLCSSEESSVDSHNDQDGELLAKLRISVDSLAPDERQMFLDVATCFHGDDLNGVVEASRACGLGGSLVWQSLLSKCLVSEYESPYDEASSKRVWMHYLLRDVGRSIDCPHLPQPIRVTGHLQALNLLSNTEGNKRVKVLKIVDWLDNPTKALNIKCLSGLEELQVLWLEGALNLTGDCHSLPNRLCFLKISEQYSYSHTFKRKEREIEKLLPILSGLQSLRSLMLGCQTVDYIPESVGTLPQLEHLEIRCPYLIRLPESLGNAPSLRRLHLIDCRNLKRLPESWGQQHQTSELEFPVRQQLHRLQHLEITDCSALTVFMTDLRRLNALEHLCIRLCEKIVGCYELTCLQHDAQEEYSIGGLTRLQSMTMKEWTLLETMPVEDFRVIMGKDEFSEPADGFSQLRVLRELTIEGDKSSSLPEYLFRQLGALQSLTISNSSLGFIPESIGLLVKLKKLAISDCYGLVSLSDAVGKLPALQELKIFKCPYLGALPESMGNLHALQKLMISGGKSIRLPESLGQLLSLEQLALEGFEVLPESLGKLQALQHLNLLHCDKLRALPASFEHLQSLKQLTISFCRHLQVLPDGLGKLPSLQALNISDCRELRSLPDSLGQLRALGELSISVWCYWNDAPNFSKPTTSELRALPEALGQLQALRQLTISRSSELTVLPESLGALGALESLRISECDNLTALPESTGQLQFLQELTILKCCEFKALPGSVRDLQALQRLKIFRCNSLKALPLESLGQLQALQELSILACSRLQLSALPLELLGQLQALQRLEIADEIDLSSFPEALGRLSKLQHLQISGRQLQVLPESLGQLQALRALTVSNCPALRSLPESLGQLQELRLLRVDTCGILTLPRSCGQVWKLEDLTIARCGSIKELPESVGHLKKLQHLNISYCAALKFLRETTVHNSCLQSLTLVGCPELRIPSDNLAGLPPSLTVESCKKIRHTLRGENLEAPEEDCDTEETTETDFLFSCLEEEQETSKSDLEVVKLPGRAAHHH